MTSRNALTAMSSVSDKKANLQLDENALIAKMKTLGSVTQNNKRAARKVARNKDTISSLLETMKSKPKFGKMVEYSIECLKNLAVDEVSIEEMIEEGVLETLMTVMKLNPYNERIQHMVNQTIQSFAINERMAALIAAKMGATPFIFSMKKHVEPETLASTCGATAKLMMKCEDNVGMFVIGGVIPALKHVMKTGEQHADVLSNALLCLAKIAENPAYAAELMASGVVQDVLDALRHFPENAAVVENAVSFLGRLAAVSPEILEQLKQMGAVDAIVQALEMHPDNQRLIELGANALKYLSGAKDVLGALQISQGNNEATAMALAKIASLMLVDENVDYMVSHEGIQWLINALQSAVGDNSEVASKILASGCRALMRMAVDENKIYGIMQQGGVKLLISIIDNHLSDEAVVCSALAALAKMVTRKENAIYIVKSGGIRAAHAALKAHPKSDKVAKAVLDLYQRIAAHEDCVPMLIENKVVDDLKEVTGNHPKNPDTNVGVINTFGRMAISAENMRAIANGGGLNCMVAILNNMRDDLNVAKQALLLIETAALLPENIEKLRDAGAMDAILGAMDAHPDDAELQQIGSRTLAMIAGEAQLKQAVSYVGQLCDQMNKSPGQAAQYIDKLLNAVKLVGNLALIDANIPALIKAGAVQTLLSAFNAAAKLPPSEKRSALLASAAAGLLRLLGKDAAACAAFVQQGGLKQLLAAALKDSENEALAEHVAELAVLCASNPKNLAKMIADGAIADLIALAKQHPLNENILAAVTKALGLMGTTDDLCRQIVKAGGAEVVVESIYANLENKDRLMNALAVLNQLCVDDNCVEAFLKAGAIDAILEAMRANAHNPDVLTLCCHSLCRLLISELVAEEIGTKGGIPLCIKAMREHYGVEPLCEIDMILLDSLASLQTNVARLLEPELATIELVTWIGSHYASNQPLNEALEKLLLALRGNKEKKKEEMIMTDESFDEAKCDVLVSKFKNAKLDKQEALNMLHNLAHNLQDSRNAEMMIARGGLQALAALMNKFKDDEQVFYTAANAFLTLTDIGGDSILEMLEEPSLMQALCNCMNAHELFDTPMDLNDLTKAVSACAKMKLKPATVSEMIKNKPLNSLMKIMVQSDDPLLLAQAARLLGKLSNNNDAALLLSKIANLRELINALRRNMKNEEFLKYGVYLLANLAVNDELKSQIGIEGGIQVILQIMDTYPNNAGLVENCVYALANLSYANEVNVSFIVACKGIALLISAMHTHNKAPELLESAVCVLCNLCHKNDNNKDAIIRQNGAQSIVDTILNNFNALDLLLTCFRTIGNLAYNVTSTTAIINAGGVQGVVAGMTVHGDNDDIIDMSIKVLTNLSSEPSTPENMKIMASEGAVQAIVEVATQHTDKLDIELAALGCLCNLARHHDNASMIIKQGGADACIRTMQALDFDTNLVANAVRLIAILSHSTPSDLERMLDNGIGESLVAAVKGHVNNRVVLTNGLLALTLLAYNTDSATRLAQKGVIQMVLRIVSDNVKNPGTLIECFPALSALSRSESNAVSMSELALKSLVSSISNNQNEAKFLPYAFTFLANLCVHSVAAEAVLNVPIAKTTLTTLALHSMSPEVMLRGLRALENMAFSTNEVKQHMKSVGVETTVTDWMTVHASHDDIRAACKAVLDALNRVDWNLEASNFKQIKMADIEKKSAKKMFGDDDKKPDTITELPGWVKNLLTAGALLTKHSNTAAPRPRHVYVTSDLKFLIWKDPKKAELHPDNKMKIFKIRTVEKGRATPQLQRKQWGKWLAKEECAFAIIGRERTVDLECPTEAERNKWVEAIELLVAYRKALKKANTQFGASLRDEA